MFTERFATRSEFAIIVFRSLPVPHFGVLLLIALVFATPVFLFAQPDRPSSTRTASNGASTQEFPVTLRQNVVAGKTQVGTKVEAKLTIATLVSGTVIPEGAVFAGKVVESSAQSASDPSRLAIRMDSVQWKNESKPITAKIIRINAT